MTPVMDLNFLSSEHHAIKIGFFTSVPVILLLKVIPIMQMYEGRCPTMFTAALLIRHWKQPKCPKYNWALTP